MADSSSATAKKILAMREEHRAILGASGAASAVQRLLASGNVDDAQAPMPEAEARLDVQIAFVRTAVVLTVVHAQEHMRRNLAP